MVGFVFDGLEPVDDGLCVLPLVDIKDQSNFAVNVI